MKLIKKSVYLFLAFITLSILFVHSVFGEMIEPVIYIDPGHGGFDGGCVGSNSIEKDIVLSVSFKLKKYLESVGYKVKLTRTKDIALAETKTLDMKKRVSLINNSNTLLYISIHANFYPSPKVSGAQVFFKNNDENKLLSKNIQDYLNLTSIGKNRKEKVITDKYLTDHIKHNGCLVEIGFLSNKEEETKLLDELYQNNIAYSIYLGILSYLEL
ncbi:MAG: N-acetylmuramoyl-L-alanine amidase [Bacilli bacterium]|nr:N-acetylmuramoyl-L-alanine amidase [Bacilli bacterium]